MTQEDHNMTSMTLDDANMTLQQAGIHATLRQVGYDLLLRTPGFLKALEFCTSNSQAKENVTTFLTRIAGDDNMVMMEGEDTSRHQRRPLHQSQHQAPASSQAQSQHSQQSRPAASQQQHARPAPSQQQQSRPAPSQQQAAPAQHQDHGTQAQDENTGERVFDTHHVYGKQASACFRAEETRQGKATIQIDAARALGEKSYDWSNKLVMQITRNDLPRMAAVVFNLLPKVELQHYGANNDKYLTLERQKNNFFLSMRQAGSNGDKGAQFAVPVSFEDMFEIRTMFMKQLVAERPEAGVNGVMTALKLYVSDITQ